MPTLQTILADIAAAQALISGAVSAYASIKADLSAEDQADVEARLAASGANLDSVRAELDTDAA